MSVLSQLHNMVGQNENILWSGRPQFKCFILESIFDPMLFVAIPCGVIYLVFFLSIYGAGPEQGVINGHFSFWAALLMTSPWLLFICWPVWFYLGQLVLDCLRYKNIAFIVTDKGFYSSRGIFSLDFKHKPFMEIARVNLHQGIIARMIGTGHIVFETSTNPLALRLAMAFDKNQAPTYRRLRNSLSIYDIPDYQHVYNLVKELQQNIYSDVQYPNDLRPTDNHGYNASYIPPENKQ